MTAVLKAPFPYFGGKSGVAAVVWERFGDVPNYVEPFAGSLAVLLARPHDPNIETINDLDGLLSNAWRAIRLDPDAVAWYADQPVVEVDLTARHYALVQGRQDLTARLMADPNFCDPKLAGWWIWGACNWIGSGWCSGQGPWTVQNGLLVKPQEVGELAGDTRQLPHLGSAGVGISRRLPHLGDAGKGVSKTSLGIRRKLPNVSSHGNGTNSEYAQNPGLYAWMRDLSVRLRRTRITCGDWTRVMGKSVTTKHGLTAVFLDPPYSAQDAHNDVYGSAYDASISVATRRWAIENGDNPLLRIALCGYDEHHDDMPDHWVAVNWKARKGYQSVNEDDEHNGHRETIWFSPSCLRPDLDKRVPLFGGEL